MQTRRTLRNQGCRAEWAAAAGIVKALAHPTRLFFVDVLAGGERCVFDLAEMVEADLSTVSKHLTILRAAPRNGRMRLLGSPAAGLAIWTAVHASVPFGSARERRGLLGSDVSRPLGSALAFFVPGTPKLLLPLLVVGSIFNPVLRTQRET